MVVQLSELFHVPKPIIGMIHLAGFDNSDKVRRALEEMKIYEEEGVDGVIVEDYHGSLEDITSTLELIQGKGLNLTVGVNVLRNPYQGFACASHYGCKFVQLDSVQTCDLRVPTHNSYRKNFPNVAVLGGVGFKYTSETGNPLCVDLDEAKPRCDVIVTTGNGTGMETPISKLKKFKRHLGDFPLFVGAGVNESNAYEQLNVVDGAIIGSYFKMHSNTLLPVDRERVRGLMNIVKRVREELGD